MKNRSNIIDFWRAVAVLLVTVFHIFMWSGSEGIGLPFGFDAIGAFGNGWIGVGMFFVLSGYCMATSSQKHFSQGIDINKYGIYFLNRYLRISGPYYISIAFWYFVINQFHVAYKPTGLVDIITHTLYVHNFTKETMYSISGVYWSIAVEMQFYIILPLIIIFFKSIRQRVFLLCLTLIISLLLNTIVSNHLVTWSLLCYLSLFIVGWLCSIYQHHLGKFFQKKALFTFFILTFLTALSYKGAGFNNMMKTYEIITSCLFSLILVSSIEIFRNKRNIVIEKLAFIGRASYSIYLYNYTCWFFERTEVTLIQKTSVFIFVIVFGVVMHLLIEKNTEKFRYWVMENMRNRKEKTITSNT